MDKFEEMRVVLAIVDAGSFAAAANVLGMSRPAVSRHLASLEERLGVRLLQRTTRRISLTEEGEVFTARCRELLAEVDEAEAEVTSRSGEAAGRLEVNAPVTFGLLHLARLWPQFMERQPKVSLNVTLSDRVVDLVEEGYDLAVRIGRLASSSLISRRITSTRLVLCASPDYLRRHGAPRTPADLAGHPVMLYTLSSMGDVWEFDGPQGREAVRVHAAMRSNSGDNCRAAALAHRGVVFQPSFLVGEDLARGDLVELMPEYRGAELGVYAVYPTRKHVSPKVRVLIEFLVEAFRERPWPE
jgi:DNA-binding transcriptional LysR family regulator